MQSRFSWAGVAAAGVGALIPGNMGPLQIGTITARTIANAGIRTLIDGTDFGDNIHAALPDVIGSTIGEAIAGLATNKDPYQQLAEEGISEAAIERVRNGGYGEQALTVVRGLKDQHDVAPATINDLFEKYDFAETILGGVAQLDEGFKIADLPPLNASSTEIASAGMRSDVVTWTLDFAGDASEYLNQLNADNVFAAQAAAWGTEIAISASPVGAAARIAFESGAEAIFGDAIQGLTDRIAVAGTALAHGASPELAFGLAMDEEFAGAWLARQGDEIDHQYEGARLIAGSLFSPGENLIDIVTTPRLRARLHGTYRDLPDGVEIKSINATIRSAADTRKMRGDFNARGGGKEMFLKDLASDPSKAAALRAAGFTDQDFARLERGSVPENFEVHHKHSLKTGGDNGLENLVLTRRDPEHYMLSSTYQEKVRGLPVGKSLRIDVPIPQGFLYPKTGRQ